MELHKYQKEFIEREGNWIIDSGRQVGKLSFNKQMEELIGSRSVRDDLCSVSLASMEKHNTFFIPYASTDEQLDEFFYEYMRNSSINPDHYFTK